MGAFDGKVAFITGGARGQGRSHAINLARHGTDVIILDICQQIPSVEYSMSTPDDLATAVELVEAEGRSALGIQGDVRRLYDIEDALRRGLERFGRLDSVVANAGIMPTTGDPAEQIDAWQSAIDTMLSGVYYTLYAASKPMLEAGRGGSMVITNSTVGLRAAAYKSQLLGPGRVGYHAAKHGLVGIMRSFAMGLGPDKIRVNAVHPMGVRTPMIENEFFAKDISDAPPGFMTNVRGVDLVEPQDISEAVLWLLSDSSRYVTGASIPVDCGLLLL